MGQLSCVPFSFFLKRNVILFCFSVAVGPGHFIDDDAVGGGNICHVCLDMTMMLMMMMMMMMMVERRQYTLGFSF